MLMSKEVIVTEPHKFEVREVPRPEAAGDYDVLVKMRPAACAGRTYITIWERTRARLIRASRDMRTRAWSKRSAPR